MLLALHILLVLVLVILGVITLVLLTPFQVRLLGGRRTGLGRLEAYAGVPLRVLGLRVSFSESTHHYRIYLLGIPVWRRPIPFERLARKKTPKTEEKTPKKDAPPKKSKPKKGTVDRLDDMVHMFRTPHVGAVARRLFRLLNPRGELDLEVGFDDPSTTGMAAAAVGLLRELLGGVALNIRYNFTGAELKGRFLLGFTIWIPQIIMGTIVTALTKEGRALIVHLWGLRRRRPARAA